MESIKNLIGRRGELELFLIDSFMKSFKTWMEGQPSSIYVQLTPAEKEWVTWAVDAMHDVAGTEDFGYVTNDIPTFGKDYVHFPHFNQGILDDLMYRLEDMAPDVAKTDARSEQQIAARYRPAHSAAKKIRAVYHI